MGFVGLSMCMCVCVAGDLEALTGSLGGRKVARQMGMFAVYCGFLTGLV